MFTLQRFFFSRSGRERGDHAREEREKEGERKGKGKGRGRHKGRDIRGETSEMWRNVTEGKRQRREREWRVIGGETY